MLCIFCGARALFRPKPLDCWGLKIIFNDTHSVGLLWTREWPVKRPLPDKSQDPQGADSHAPGVIRTRNPSQRAAAHLDLVRPATGFGSVLLDMIRDDDDGDDNGKIMVIVIQGGSNMTGTDLCVNKPHCAAAVRP